MAQENGAPSAEEKGKGKAEEEKLHNGKKPDEVKKDKDGKPVVNGTKGDELEEGRVNSHGINEAQCSC